jgi:hypothetical protein
MAPDGFHRLTSARLPGLYIEADTPLASTPDWEVPLLLFKGMMAGTDVDIGEPISARLAGNLRAIQEIYTAWIGGGRVVRVTAPVELRQPSAGVSVFFSGGVDSFYSLLKHRDELDNIILIHGFDIPLDNPQSWAEAEKLGRQAAALFGKRLIVVRTNVHYGQQMPCEWKWYWGPTLAAIIHALAPVHHKVYIASSYSYADAKPDGSSALTDPLWSSEAVTVVHDGGERRIDKLRAVAAHPDTLRLLRVCWENTGINNCGQCEKCIRTMLPLLALGVSSSEAFPHALTPRTVRELELPIRSLPFWREIQELDLPPAYKSAVRSAMSSSEYGLPPRTGYPKREIKRALYAGRAMLRVLRALRH